MNVPDLINGSFELFGSALLWLNVYQLYQDGQIKGVHIAPVILWCCWGIWNLYYYPHLGQWLSFFGGISVALANCTWVSQMIYYKLKERKQKLVQEN